MSEKNCYLCQEPKSVVGHDTQSCPNVKCKKCGQKGHIFRNCQNLNLNIVQKPIDNVCSKEIKSEKSVVLHNDAKILDFVEETMFSEDIKPKFEVKEETLKSKDSGRTKKTDPIMLNDNEMVDFVHAIEFSDDTKIKVEIKQEPIDIKSSSFDGIIIKSEFKEEMAKSKSSDTVESKISNEKEIMDFVHDIEFSEDNQQKLEIKEEPFSLKSSMEQLEMRIFDKNFKQEIKEEPIDMKGSLDSIKIKSEFKDETFKGSKIDQRSDVLESRVPKHRYNHTYNLLDKSIGELEESYRSRNYNFNDFKHFQVLDTMKRQLPMAWDKEDEKSIKFTTNGDKKEVQLRRFEAVSHNTRIGNSYSMFVGGPITTSDWCPGDWNSHDIIALSAMTFFDEGQTPPSTSDKCAFIQLWTFDWATKSCPKLSALLAVETVTKINCLKWCPSLKKEDNVDQRLGLLAAACSDGTIKIYTIGQDMLQENETVTQMLVPQVSMTLKRPGLINQDSIECLEISWYRGKGHRIIAGAFNDGYVAIWDLCVQSPLLKSDPGSLLPLHILRGHQPSNKVCLAFSEQDGSPWPKYLFTGSSDTKLCTWDLSHPIGPSLQSDQTALALAVKSISWLGHHEKSTICVAYEDSNCVNNNRSMILADNFTERGVGAILHNSSVLSTEFSPFLNVIGSSDAGGNVVLYIGESRRDPTQSLRHQKHPSLRRFFLCRSRLATDPKDLNYMRSLAELKKNYPELSMNFTDKVDNFLIVSDKEKAMLKDRGGMAAQDLRKYPLLSINQINFSPNNHSKAWIFTGAQSGLGRLFYVPDLVKLDQNPESNVCPREIKSEKSEMHNDVEVLDFVHDIEFSDDIKPKLEIKEEPIDLKSIKRKSEFMEDTLKAKISKTDQKPDEFHDNTKLLDFVNEITFSEDIEPKLEVKEEMLKAKSSDWSRNNLMKKLEMSQEFKRPKYFCDVCHVNNMSQKNLKQHLAGKKHLKMKVSKALSMGV